MENVVRNVLKHCAVTVFVQGDDNSSIVSFKALASRWQSRAPPLAAPTEVNRFRMFPRLALGGGEGDWGTVFVRGGNIASSLVPLPVNQRAFLRYRRAQDTLTVCKCFFFICTRHPVSWLRRSGRRVSPSPANWLLCASRAALVAVFLLPRASPPSLEKVGYLLGVYGKMGGGGERGLTNN